MTTTTTEAPLAYPAIAREIAARIRSTVSYADHWRAQIDRREVEISHLRAYIAQLEQESDEGYRLLAELGWAKRLEHGDWQVIVPDAVDVVPHPSEFLND